YRVDGQQPLGVAFPATAEEVAAVLRAAREAGFSVLLRGAGRDLHLGSVPAPIGLVLSLARLDSVVEYDADNLTITAQAGVTLEKLQSLVGERGQFLPFDPPSGDAATLGGIAAGNRSGSLRMAYGPPRDLVIGSRVALADGSLVKTGGKTVKNVAGYELGKLFIGSLGTLGAIVELTVRLVPRPEARLLLATSLPLSEAASVAAQLLASRFEINSLAIVNRAAAQQIGSALPLTDAADKYVLLVGLAGMKEAIDRQERETRALLPNTLARVDGAGVGDVWERVKRLAYRAKVNATLLRVNVPIAEGQAMLDLVSSRQGWSALGYVGDGLVYASPPPDLDPMEARTHLERIRERAEQLGGFAILESGPVDLKRRFPVWGENLPNIDLMRELKQSYDPTDTLGCGRFVLGP
ncbi:MAG: FAD-binding oxidoreductase, partial [Proteobacteria bacterium]|nr:FAD-binding oxidoreductase [Pseudomonadota bacterium]